MLEELRQAEKPPLRKRAKRKKSIKKQALHEAKVILITIMVCMTAYAILTLYNEQKKLENLECQSCASFQEDIEEWENPTIIPMEEESKKEKEVPVSVEEIIEDVGKEVGLANWEIDTFKQLAWLESRYDPKAVSATNDHGLLQINARYWDFNWNKIYEPEYNVKFAMTEVYPKQGFEAWATYKMIN